MTPESKVKSKVKKILKEMGCYYSMTITGGYGNSGAPDFFVCYGGRFYGIECKAQGNKPTTLQLSNLEAIRASGGVTLVIDEFNVEDLKNLIRDSVDPITQFQGELT